jgi:hypothetical protein
MGLLIRTLSAAGRLIRRSARAWFQPDMDPGLSSSNRASYFPGFLERRRRSEQTLLGVVQQAYVCGQKPSTQPGSTSARPLNQGERQTLARPRGRGDAEAALFRESKYVG